MAHYAITRPSEPVAAAFGEIVRSLVDSMSAAIHQSCTLATLRDTLLPKLISGELRAKDAGKFVEEIV